eukprot:TRINITY_DN8258_c0_g1_i1.p1 TRINITY_DN8258_c0_g1~~TRINITY_DN8258_c0_g1_i1.p1  ORF type:complete len:405 (+),score=58.78 TRINITY_DN8258_c0_g1_i1:76-1215(+)
MLRNTLRVTKRYCSAKGLDWSDEVVAAHVKTVVLPELMKKQLSPDEAVTHLKTELAHLKNLGCFVWTKAWATAMSYFVKRTKGRAAREANQEATQRMFDVCIQSGVDPNSDVYCKAIEAQHSYKECRILFDFMVLDGTKPNEDTIASILRICRKYSSTGRHKAESLMSFMEHEGIISTTYIWNLVLKLHAEKGDLAGCADVFLRMQAANLKVDSLSYECFLQACSNSANSAENLDIAENAAYQAHTDNIPLTNLSYGYLMKVYRITNNSRRAHALYKNVKDSKLSTKLLIEYSKLLDKSFGDPEAKKMSKKLMKLARRRYITSIKARHPKVYEAMKKARSKKKPIRRKKKKASDVDIIGDAIKRHLQRQSAKVWYNFSN